MNQCNGPEDPACRHSARSKETPGCRCKVDDFYQKTQGARHADDRCSSITGDSEDSPNRRGEQGKSNHKQEAQGTIKLGPAVIAKGDQSGKLKEEAEREVEWILTQFIYPFASLSLTS